VGKSPDARITKMLNALRPRIKAFREVVTKKDFNLGKYSEKELIRLLEEFLHEINEQKEIKDYKTQVEIRKILATLTQYEILPSAASWPRRYFYQMAYMRPWEPPQQRFIYKAFNSLYREQGFEKGWDDPKVAEAKREVDNRLRDFYSIRPSIGWSKDGIRVDVNSAALELSKILVRLFYVEGLATELLEAWKSYEPFVYLSRRHYRDHFLHLIYDFLLGCRMIEGLLGRIYCNWKRYTKDTISADKLRLRMMRSWLIASLFHDIGYTAETLENIRGTLQNTFFSKIPGFELSPLRMKNKEYIKEEIDGFLFLLAAVFTEDEFSFNFASFGENFAKIAARYPNSLIWGATRALFADQLSRMDHGIIGALFILLTMKVDIHELTVESQKEREDYEKDRSEILEDLVVGALAISLHNIRQNVYQGLTIDFRSHPTVFLLMLCDEMHEWDREYDWRRTTEAFRAVYGFDVFPIIENPRKLLEEKIEITDMDGQKYEHDSFFHYLHARTRVNGTPFKKELIPEEVREIINRGSDAKMVKSEIENFLLNNKGLSPETKLLLKVLTYILANEVITLTYIGGDLNKRALQDDRVLSFWNNLDRLFSKNLSNGPSICILHGYVEQEVDLFFAAEYIPTLKSYKVETPKPGPRNKYRKS